MIKMKDIVVGAVFQSKNHGEFEITHIESSLSIMVRFLKTSYEVKTNLSCIRLGLIRDRLRPVVFGLGFIGDGCYKPSENGENTREYNTWKGMFFRCYCEKFHEKYPTYKGCTVDKVWHDFQVFAKWYHDNYFEGCQIDKDIKIRGNKVYSPETCMMATHKENSTEAHAKHYKFINPIGEVVEVYNLADFCRNNDLNTGHMCNVAKGNLNHHKGWKNSGG